MKKSKFIVIILGLMLLTGCGKVDLTKGTIEKIGYEETTEVTNYVKIETTKDKVILLELYPEIAPISVKNFQDLVNEKFYDGLIFHRVVKDFVIQTGAFNVKNEYKDAKTITGEFAENGIENALSHTMGVVSMARTSDDNDSASSQFFICLNDVTALDDKYAAFGKVIAGMDNVKVIGEVSTENEKPTINQVIRSIRFVKINK